MYLDHTKSISVTLMAKIKVHSNLDMSILLQREWEIYVALESCCSNLVS